MKVLSIAKFQWLMIWRSPEQLASVLLIPLSTFIAAAIIDHGGRPDLLYYSLVAMSVMTIAQTGFLAASELFVTDRASGTLEAMVATTASYSFVLVVRILIVTASGVLGTLVSYFILKLCFAAQISIYHPVVAVGAIAGVVFGSGGVALLLAALICRARSSRTVQNSVSGPLFLLAGVLAPVGLLSPWLELPGRVIYLSWAADLLRDSLIQGEPKNVIFRMTMLVCTGMICGALGAMALSQMLKRLRRDGALIS
jgi:ABC-2 type transport system permease protein